MADDSPTLPSFRAEIGTAELKRLVDVLRPIAAEVRLDVSADGIRCAVVDASHVAMAVVTFGRAGLFELDVTRPGVLAVDLEKFAELVKIPRGESCYKRTERGEAVFSLALDPLADRPRLTATLETPNRATITRTMGIVDPSGVTAPNVPHIVPTVTAGAVDAESLAKALKDAGKIADHVALNRSRSGVHVAAESDLGATATDVPACDLTGKGRAVYPLDFLGKFAGAVKRADDVALGWGREYPLKIAFRWGAETHPEVSGYYLLACRVDDEAPEPWYARDRSGWYDWAMRAKVAAEPCLEAAAVDSVPDDVVQMELERVAAVNLTRAIEHAARSAEYPALLETHRLALERYEAETADTLSKWRALHPKARKGPPRSWLPTRPGPPFEPGRPVLEELFSDGHRFKYHPSPEGRREMRGRNPTGVSWGPARPEPAGTAPPETKIAGLEPPAAPEPATIAAEPDPPIRQTPSPPVAVVSAQIAEAFGMAPLIEAGLAVVRPPVDPAPEPEPSIPEPPTVAPDSLAADPTAGTWNVTPDGEVVARPSRSRPARRAPREPCPRCGEPCRRKRGELVHVDPTVGAVCEMAGAEPDPAPVGPAVADGEEAAGAPVPGLEAAPEAPPPAGPPPVAAEPAPEAPGPVPTLPEGLAARFREPSPGQIGPETPRWAPAAPEPSAAIAPPRRRRRPRPRPFMRRDWRGPRTPPAPPRPGPPTDREGHARLTREMPSGWRAGGPAPRSGLAPDPREGAAYLLSARDYGALAVLMGGGDGA